MACGFNCKHGYDWTDLTQIATWWDGCMTIYKCTRCGVTKFEYSEGSYMNCPLCGHDDYHGSCDMVERAFESALRYRFW